MNTQINIPSCVVRNLAADEITISIGSLCDIISNVAMCTGEPHENGIQYTLDYLEKQIFKCCDNKIIADHAISCVSGQLFARFEEDKW